MCRGCDKSTALENLDLPTHDCDLMVRRVRDGWRQQFVLPHLIDVRHGSDHHGNAGLGKMKRSVIHQIARQDETTHILLENFDVLAADHPEE